MTPGIYPGLSFAEYQAIPALNFSKLKLLASTPAKAKWQWDHPEEPTEAMVFGTWFHTAALQPEDMPRFVEQPDEYEAKGGEWKKWSNNAHWCRAWNGARETEGRTIVKPMRGLPKPLEALRMMRRAVLCSVLTRWGSQSAVADEPTECQKALVAIERPVPESPSAEQAREYLRGTSYLHIFVEGKVSVEFTVHPAGDVSDVKILESVEKPVGRGAGNVPDGYFEGFLRINAIPTVERWRDQPIEQFDHLLLVAEHLRVPLVDLTTPLVDTEEVRRLCLARLRVVDLELHEHRR